MPEQVSGFAKILRFLYGVVAPATIALLFAYLVFGKRVLRSILKPFFPFMYGEVEVLIALSGVVLIPLAWYLYFRMRSSRIGFEGKKYTAFGGLLGLVIAIVLFFLFLWLASLIGGGWGFS